MGAGVKVLVCGGRDFRSWGFIYSQLNQLNAREPFSCVIEGGASGVDNFARIWAQERRIAVVTVKADWATHGKAAGPLRNAKMLIDHDPDLVVAFPGGRGTASMVRLAHQYAFRVIEVAP